MEFENGSTASFTMIAFTKKTCVREVKIFGTKGEIRCEFDENLVRQADFVSGQTCESFIFFSLFFKYWLGLSISTRGKKTT